MSSTAVVSASLSDRVLIGYIRKTNCQKHSSRTIKCRDYRNYDSYKLVNDANNIDWNPVYNNNFDVNAAVNYFTGQLKSLFDEHAPIIEKRVRGKPFEWIDESVKKELNKRDTLLRKAQKSNE